MFPRNLLAAVLLLLICGAAIGQTTARDDSAGLFSSARFRAHVAFLSDDLLEGRDTGSRGHDIAAAYVATQFEALGLEPAGDKGSWFQTVPLRVAERGSRPARVTISGPGGSKSWTSGSDVLAGPSMLEASQDIKAPVVFVGYGLDAPDQGLDDYRGLDVRGKVVAMLSGAPADVPTELAAHFGNQKGVMAARHGAIGMITVGTKLSDATTSWQARVRFGSGRSMDWLGSTGEPVNDAPGLRFSIRFNSPASEALFAGSAKGYAVVRAEAERKNARPAGFPLRSEVRLTRASSWSLVTSRNVISMLPGADPKLRNEYVVLMGHLDHIGIKKNALPGQDSINNGALDNAAGIATMLEAARAFVESGDRPRRSILFIANTAEEKGLLGADYFANHATVPAGQIVAAVDLDMPLLLYDFTDVIAFGANHSTVAESVARAAARMGVALSPDPMPQESIFVRSDHYTFVKKGIPAIMLATGFANGGAARWNAFLAGPYHDVNDDMTQPIRWDQGARFARLNYLISRDLADADKRPMWYAGDYFGNAYAPAQPKAVAPKR